VVVIAPGGSSAFASVGCLAAMAFLFAGCSPQGDGAGQRTEPAAVATWTPLDTRSLPSPFGYGRPASDAEIAALDIGIRPDGSGLPVGHGTVVEGGDVYAARCASCHGAGGEGTPVGTRLVGQEPIDSTGWNRTIGNFWPYATTLFDYIRRSMPSDRPRSLSDPEVYAVTAYLLHLNGIIPADAVLDAETLPRVQMPARDRFVPDDREGNITVR
jgi:S-disulfanyl-L-cysteine oxidoreductase SoxD